MLRKGSQSIPARPLGLPHAHLAEEGVGEAVDDALREGEAARCTCAVCILRACGKAAPRLGQICRPGKDGQSGSGNEGGRHWELQLSRSCLMHPCVHSEASLHLSPSSTPGLHPPCSCTVVQSVAATGTHSSWQPGCSAASPAATYCPSAMARRASRHEELSSRTPGVASASCPPTCTCSVGTTGQMQLEAASSECMQG